MSVLRKFLLVIALGLTLYLIWIGIDETWSGPGMGEVSTILFPFLVMFFVFAAAFAGTVVALIALWHRRRARIILLVIVSVAVTVTIGLVGSIWIGGIMSDRAWAREQAEKAQFEADREAAIRPIAERYFALLVSGTLSDEEIAALRSQFDLEVEQTGFDNVIWARSTGYFRSAHDPYMRLFIYSADNMPELVGIHDPNACLDIHAEYAAGFNDRQNSQYAEFCPESVTRYAK